MDQVDGRSRKGSPLCKRGHLKEFGKDCRECNRLRCAAWFERNRAEFLEDCKQRYAENRDEILARNKEWCERNPDKVRAAQKTWRERNREHVNAESRKRYSRIAAVHAERVKSWKGRNPEKWREINNAAKNRRRVRLKGNGGSHTVKQWQALCKRQGGKCAICGEVKRLTRDHIVPLKHGGTDSIKNIQGLCARCNSRKGTKLVLTG